MVKILSCDVLVTAFVLVCDTILCSSLMNVNTINIQRSKRSLFFDPTKNFSGILSTTQQNSGDACLPTILSCNPSDKYRTFDGSCNNLQNPAWGIAHSPVVRLLSPTYADGISKIRLGQNGSALPSPRIARTTLLPEGDTPDPELTLGVMAWGQMIAHDVALRVLPAQGDAPGNCCNGDGSFNPHPACLPIAVPSNDPFYSKYKTLCLDMKRVSTTNNTGCLLSPVHQISGSTHFMDGSFIYGLDKDKSNALRLFRGGLLKTQTTEDGRPFLINVQKPTKVCDVPNDTDVCYLSGDPDRVNLNTEIAASSVMFMRLHNILATDLRRLNSTWSDEILYQEARRIVVAIVQHITYNEYLPVLLGSAYVKNNNLAPQQSGYSKGYNASVNPSSISEFVSAAFRSFHSSITGTPSLVRENRTVSRKIQLSYHTNRPGVIQASDNFDYFLRGLISQPQSDQDAKFTGEIANSFLRRKDRKPAEPNGTDLISIDINRGRDYGVPPYTTTRRLCGLPPVNKFEDLKDVMEADKISLLKKVYSSVHDIDYFVGGILEKKLPGSLTTPSFQCVVVEAFFRYKFADRFYYEFNESPGAFTLAQLDTIRKFTYSALVCLASDGLEYAQPSGFRILNSTSNPLKPCSEITKAFKLDAWV